MLHNGLHEPSHSLGLCEKRAVIVNGLRHQWEGEMRKGIFFLSVRVMKFKS